jgi:predicted DNA-binding transcriptional regulator AlpA
MQMEATEQIGGKNNAMTAQSIIADEFMTRDSLARDLGVSVRTIDRWVSLRLGPPRISIGKLILFCRSAVLKWLSSREDGTRIGKRRSRRAA